MKIALILENSQADKNPVIFRELSAAAKNAGHTVDNYGMYSAKDKRCLTYVMNGLLASIVLNTKAADFVVTGCGTGEGAMLAANAMPGVTCGLVTDPADSYRFTQVNGGNCMSLPFAKGWGWAAEVNLEYVFEKLFAKERGGGYPPSAAASEQRNAKLLNKLKAVSHNDILSILKSEDPDVHDIVKNAFAGKRMELFRADCKDETILKAVEAAVAE